MKRWHDWRGLHRDCTCGRRLEPRFGSGWYGWCSHCRSAWECACPFWRAPWSWLMRKALPRVYLWWHEHNV